MNTQIYRSAAARMAQAATLLLITCKAFALTHWVNDTGSFAAPGTSCSAPGYPNITMAINAAAAGDFIRVCPGAYGENLVIKTPKLRIISTHGPYASIVKSVSPGLPVITIDTSGVTIDGLGIVPAGTADNDNGIQVVGGGGLALLQNNVIRTGWLGIQIGCTSGKNQINDNLITGQHEAAINLDTCENPVGPQPGTFSNTVSRNVACGKPFYASIVTGGTASNNIIQDNRVVIIKIFGNGNTVQNNVSRLPVANMGTGTVQAGNIDDPGVCT